MPLAEGHRCPAHRLPQGIFGDLFWQCRCGFPRYGGRSPTGCAGVGAGRPFHSLFLRHLWKREDMALDVVMDAPPMYF